MRRHDEIELSRAVSAFLRQQLDRVLETPDWDREDKLLVDVIEPILRYFAMDEAVRARNELLRSRQEGGLFDRIWVWATKYTYELVGGINGNTRKRLATAIADFVSATETMGTLREAVADIFTPERAQLIAVTEVTRAYSAGGEAAADELRATGLEIIERWNTLNDGSVCSECASKNGETIGPDGDRPPLHPGCRCGTSREIA